MVRGNKSVARKVSKTSGLRGGKHSAVHSPGTGGVRVTKEISKAAKNPKRIHENTKHAK